MQQVRDDNFGLAIAYLLPGFVTLWGVSLFSETVRAWLGSPAGTAPTVGGFLYVTLGSLAAGLLVSIVRWAVIDTIHHRTGIPQPDWRFEALQEKLAAFETLIAHHYRYYQAYGNMLVAIPFAYSLQAIASGRVSLSITVAVVVIELLLWFGSRDTLRKYYQRGRLLLGTQRGMVETSSKPGAERRILNIDGPLR